MGGGIELTSRRHHIWCLTPPAWPLNNPYKHDSQSWQPTSAQQACGSFHRAVCIPAATASNTIWQVRVCLLPAAAVSSSCITQGLSSPTDTPLTTSTGLKTNKLLAFASVQTPVLGPTGVCSQPCCCCDTAHICCCSCWCNQGSCPAKQPTSSKPASSCKATSHRQCCRWYPTI